MEVSKWGTGAKLGLAVHSRCAHISSKLTAKWWLLWTEIITTIYTKICGRHSVRGVGFDGTGRTAAWLLVACMPSGTTRNSSALTGSRRVSIILNISTVSQLKLVCFITIRLNLLSTYVHISIQWYINAVQRNLPPFGEVKLIGGYTTKIWFE